jgi:hypothetical protein
MLETKLLEASRRRGVEDWETVPGSPISSIQTFLSMIHYFVFLPMRVKFENRHSKQSQKPREKLILKRFKRDPEPVGVYTEAANYFQNLLILMRIEDELF